MGKRKKLKIIPIIMLVFVIFFASDHANGARHTQFLKVKPQMTSSPNTFKGFLPKGVPIPPSGPSKRHNSVGLDGGGGGLS